MQYFFWALRCCTPTLLLGLEGVAMQNSFKAVECCNAILLLRLQGVATQHSFWGLGSCSLPVRIAALLSFFLSFFPALKQKGAKKKKGRQKKKKGAEK